MQFEKIAFEVYQTNQKLPDEKKTKTHCRRQYHEKRKNL